MIEVATITTETRNREINRSVDPGAFSSFSYVRGMNFGDERRRIREETERRDNNSRQFRPNR